MWYLFVGQQNLHAEKAIGAWWATVHGVSKSQTRLSDCTFTFHFHALEKEMATHSSVLAWRIPGMGEPGGLPSMDGTELDTTEVTQQQQHTAYDHKYEANTIFTRETILCRFLNEKSIAVTKFCGF